MRMLSINTYGGIFYKRLPSISHVSIQVLRANIATCYNEES